MNDVVQSRYTLWQLMAYFLRLGALGWAYTSFGGLAWMQAVFYGVGAAVIGIMVISAHKLATKNIGHDKLLRGIFVVLAAVTAITQSEIAWLVIVAAAALIGLAIYPLMHQIRIPT